MSTIEHNSPCQRQSHDVCGRHSPAILASPVVSFLSFPSKNARQSRIYHLENDRTKKKVFGESPSSYPSRAPNIAESTCKLSRVDFRNHNFSALAVLQPTKIPPARLRHKESIHASTERTF